MSETKGVSLQDVCQDSSTKDLLGHLAALHYRTSAAPRSSLPERRQAVFLRRDLQQ